jgi:Domain of unknown function (DUF5615)
MVSQDNSTKIRFQADADFNQKIVKAVLRREPFVDFQSAKSADLEGVQDPEVLLLAAQQGRLLVSHDRTTMPQHFADFVATQTSAGVLIVPKSLLIAEVVEDLILIWLVETPQEWVNRIRFLPI